MVMPGQGQGQKGLGKMFEEMTGFPSPEKIMVELQTLNQNIQKLAPDIHQIAASMDGLNASEIRNLIQVLKAANINEATKALQQIYTRLWGR